MNRGIALVGPIIGLAGIVFGAGAFVGATRSGENNLGSQLAEVRETHAKDQRDTAKRFQEIATSIGSLTEASRANTEAMRTLTTSIDKFGHRLR